MAVYEVVAVQRIPASSGAPTLTELGPLRAAIEYTDELYEAPVADLSMDLRGVQDDIKEALRDLVATPLEAWIYRDGEFVFAGPVIAGDVSDKSTLNLTARGIEFYMRYMTVEQDRTFSSTDLYDMVTTVVDYWQGLSYGHYGIDTSGIGSSGTTADLFIPGATEPRDVFEVVQEIGNFDFYVDPETRALVLGTRGSDLSTSVFLERGVRSPAVQFTVAPGVIASDIFVTGTNSGADPLTATATNAGIRPTFGRAGAALSIDGVDSQARVDAAATRAAASRANGYFQPGPGLVPVAGADVDDFGVGDTVTYTFDAGLGQQTGAYRIRKRQVSVSAEGQETMTVEFA